MSDGPAPRSAGATPSPGVGVRGWLALAAILCSAWATVLESMAVGVTLPAISEHFGVAASTATWVLGAAQFVIVALLLPLSALGEVVGYRRVFLGSLLVFSLGTVACLLAPTFPALVAGRIVQAVGTAGAMSLGFAMIRTIFPDDRLGTAIGLLAANVAVASSLGPAISGVILSASGWRPVFGLLLAISLFAVAVGSLTLPSGKRSVRRYDVTGAALVAVTFSALLVVINGVANGWPTGLVLTAAALAAGTLVVVVARSRRDTAPVFPVDLFARPVFSLSVVASVSAFAAQTLGFVLLPFYLVYGAGMSELEMALCLSVWPMITAIIAPIVGRLANRLPAGPTGAAGLAVLAAGFLSLASLDSSASFADIALRLMVCGAGFAVFQTPNNRLVMLSAPRERTGAASGTLSLARQSGRAIGTALAAFALSGGPVASLDAMVIAAAIACLGAGASLGRIRAGRSAAS